MGVVLYAWSSFVRVNTVLIGQCLPYSVVLGKIVHCMQNHTEVENSVRALLHCNPNIVFLKETMDRYGGNI
jgi:hypothetical protein